MRYLLYDGYFIFVLYRTIEDIIGADVSSQLKSIAKKVRKLYRGLL